MAAEIKHTETGRILIPAASFTIKHRDYFNLGNLYRLMYFWLVDEGFVSKSGSAFPETFYLNRESQKRGGEIIIWWRIKKNVDKYYRYILNLNLTVLMLRTEQVMHQGQKFKSNWGEVTVQLDSKLELDYQHESSNGWRDHPFLKHIHTTFSKRIFKKDIEFAKLDLYRYSYRFQDAIKGYIQKPSYLPEKEDRMLWPEAGLGETK
jgi:hypothetical protein|tara:strand:- start:915 stop:1532 length:618 start_codon:yes stop_codon:yes gene_type:complete